MQKNRSITIDIMRIIAALAVVVYHYGFWSWAYSKSTPYRILEGRINLPELAPVASNGWVGVEIFFVISGLVIFNSASGSDARSFFLKRFLRLWPAAAICACLTASFLLFDSASPIAVSIAVVKTITFWPFYGWVDPVYWTLGIEIAFYSLIFLLLAVNASTFMEPVINCVGIASCLYWLIVYMIAPVLGGGFPITFIGERLAQLFLLQHGIYFALGGLLYTASQKGWTLMRILISLILASAGTLPIVWKAMEDSRFTGLELSKVWPVAIWLVAVLLIACAHQLDGVAERLPRGVKATVERFGLATYPVYLIHTVTGAIMMKYAIDLGVSVYTALFLAFFCVTAFGLAVTYIETPIRKCILRSINPKPVPN